MRGRAWLSAWTSRGSCGPLGGPAAGRSGRWRARATRRAAQGGPGVPAPQSLGAFGQGARCPAESVPVRGLRALARGAHGRVSEAHWSLLAGRSPLGCGCLGSCSARGHHSCSPGGSSGPYGVIIRSGTSTSRTASRSTAWAGAGARGTSPVARAGAGVCRCGGGRARLCFAHRGTAAARGGAARRCVSTRAAAPRGRPVAGGGAPAPALSGPGLSRPASRHGFPVLAARRTWIHGPGGVDPGAPRLPAVARVVSLGMVIGRRCPVGLRVRGPVQRSPPGFGSYGPR